MASQVLVDRPSAGVLRVELNRPYRRSAIDQALLEEHTEALEAPRERVVVLGSSSDTEFCAGGDLSLSPEELQTVSDGLCGLYQHLLSLPCILIIAADGRAIGAGARLMLCADLRVAGRGLLVSFLGVNSGLVVGAWGLRDLVGRGRAMDLSLTGRRVTAQEALGMGLVDRLVEDPRALAASLAEEVAGAPEPVLRSVRSIATDRNALIDALQKEDRKFAPIPSRYGVARVIDSEEAQARVSMAVRNGTMSFVP